MDLLHFPSLQTAVELPQVMTVGYIYMKVSDSNNEQHKLNNAW